MTRRTSQKRRLTDGGTEDADKLQSPSVFVGIDAFRHEDCRTTWYQDRRPHYCPGCGEPVGPKFTVVGPRNDCDVDTDRDHDDARTDGGTARPHGREYARQQARDHRDMQRANYLRDGRTSGGRRL